jgi:Ca2+-binding EF-hand superfamily protein
MFTKSKQQNRVKAPLTTEQIEELKEAFLYLDEDNTGAISFDKFAKFLSWDPKKVRTFLLHDLKIKSEDLRNDEITFPVFLTIVARKIDQNETGSLDESRMSTMNETEIRYLFDCFDKDGDQSITYAELRDLMSSGLGEHLSEEEIKQMVQNADEGDDLMINFEEFKDILLNQR